MILRLSAESTQSRRPGVPLGSVLLGITEQGQGYKADVCRCAIIVHTLDFLLAISAISPCTRLVRQRSTALRKRAGDIWEQHVLCWCPYLHCLSQDFLHKCLLPLLLSSVKY